MEPEVLIVELFYAGAWHEAAELTVLEPSRGSTSRTHLSYVNAYVALHAADLGARDSRAVGEAFPVGFEVWSKEQWPAFLLDIVPSGAARQWWSRRLATDQLGEGALEHRLLRDHTVAPIGHARIARPGAEMPEPVPFTKDEVCRRDVAFLEYAAESGAAIGGATGAGGDAPKILLSEDAAGNVYPDGTLPDEETVACWLVKWPRGRDTERDRIVLHTEHLYAHALAALGLETCPGEWQPVDEGKPSLWLPRFDRVLSARGLERLAVESFYSLAGVTQPGATVSHQTYLEALEGALDARGQKADLPAMVREVLCRDFLDVVLGNSDNHGRNRAVRRGTDLRLAPIYDLAPMVMDPEGVTRSSRWANHERGGRIDWRAVCAELDRWAAPGAMWESLREFAARLLVLPEMLRDAGIDEQVMAFPRIPLGRLPDALQEWGLQ